MRRQRNGDPIEDLEGLLVIAVMLGAGYLLYKSGLLDTLLTKPSVTPRPSTGNPGQAFAAHQYVSAVQLATDSYALKGGETVYQGQDIVPGTGGMSINDLLAGVGGAPYNAAQIAEIIDSALAQGLTE